MNVLELGQKMPAVLVCWRPHSCQMWANASLATQELGKQAAATRSGFAYKHSACLYSRTEYHLSRASARFHVLWHNYIPL
jgi:hypothetical protein